MGQNGPSTAPRSSKVPQNCIRLDKIAPKGPKTAHKGRKWDRMDPELLLGAANCIRLDKITPKRPQNYS